MNARLAVAGLAVALLLAGCTGSSPDSTTPSTPPAATTQPPASPSGPSGSPSGSTAPVAIPCDGPAVTVPVYYLGTDQPVSAATFRLFREFHRAPSCPGGVIETAVTAMLETPPDDPDYVSRWPDGTRVQSVEVDGSTAHVDLSDYLIAAGAESQSVQQLVWTVTAADPSVTRVSLTVDGALPPTGSLDPGAFVATRGNALDTLAHVWILQPLQGDTVGSPVRIRVYGTGFEGNVVLKVFRDDEVVRTTNVTTMMGGFATASTTVRLPAGTYVLKAYNDNGRNAKLQLWDTKDFTVA